MPEHCTLAISLKFSDLEGRSMQAKITVGGRQTEIKDIIGRYVFVTDIMLPEDIEIEFFGKNQGVDTLVDANGKIIKDKHVKIESISLDGIELPKNFLTKGIRLVTEDQNEIFTNYVGFNSRTCIQFTRSNVFFQVAEINRNYD